MKLAGVSLLAAAFSVGCAVVAGPGSGPAGNDRGDGGLGGHLEDLDLSTGPSPEAADLKHVAADLAGPTVAPGCHPVINEVQTGTSQTGTDEFVEIYNPCTTAISLGGWKLVYRAVSNTNAASGADSSALFTWASGTLAAGGYRVYGGAGFTGTMDGSMSSGIAASGAVGLRDAAGALVDSVAWGSASGSSFAEGASAPLPPVVASPGNSIARIPNGADSDDNATDFQTSAHATPGAANQ